MSMRVVVTEFGRQDWVGREFAVAYNDDYHLMESMEIEM